MWLHVVPSMISAPLENGFKAQCVWMYQVPLWIRQKCYKNIPDVTETKQVFLVEKSIISTPKENQRRSFQFEMHADLFYNMHRTVHNKWILQGWNVNQHLYADIMWYLWEDMWWESPENYHAGDRFLHHDSAPVHATLCRNLSSCTLHTPQIQNLKFFILTKLKL